MKIDSEIAKRIPKTIRYLDEKSFVISESKYSPSSFGNFHVILSDGERTIRIINDRGQLFGEVFNSQREWEWIESYLKRQGVLVDDLQSNLNYDENRLLDLLQSLVESAAA
jgi:hypothetical protein